MDAVFDIEKAFYKQFGFPLDSNIKIAQHQSNPQAPTAGDFAGKLTTSQNTIARTDLYNTAKASRGSNYYKAYYGGYYFLPVTIYYTNRDTNAKVSFDLPLPVISIENGKDIISTSMVERQGSVHEIINTNDILINIKGFIVNRYNNFPEDEISDLFYKVFVPNQTVQIKNALTDIFFINSQNANNNTSELTNVVVKRLNFPPVKGMVGVKIYELDLVSDLIFDLENVPAT